MSVLELARPEIRALKSYSTPPLPEGFARLNANEAPTYPYGKIETGPLNRYPDLQPDALRNAMAEAFGVSPDQVCPTRGSSEGIDLLVRSFCRAYTDNVVIMPPTFEMYGVYSSIQGCEVRQAPLDADNDFAVDWDAVNAQCDKQTRLVFLCSPNNPTGTSIPFEEIAFFCEQSQGRNVVVADEAYIEFSDQPSTATLLDKFDNLVILRTLSKARALAGTRCGAVVGDPALIGVISALLSPYAFSTPVTVAALNALDSAGRQQANKLIADILSERQRMADALENSATIEKCWPSDANFLFVRFADPGAASAAFADQNVLVRTYDSAALAGCARITIGTREENDRVLAALAAGGAS